MIGTVYFVAAPGRIKIGFTRNPADRLNALRKADMEELTVLWTMPGSPAHERAIHKKLVAFRIKGEWFADCAEVRSVIEELRTGGAETLGAVEKPRTFGQSRRSRGFDFEPDPDDRLSKAIARNLRARAAEAAALERLKAVNPNDPRIQEIEDYIDPTDADLPWMIEYHAAAERVRHSREGGAA